MSPRPIVTTTTTSDNSNNNMTPKKMNSPLTSNQIIPSHNPIQLAAISNYKLAQLTFAPPDLHSLRKTAVIKNMIEDVYSNTPAEWLQQMTRWQYFTPESLEEMTQEGLEEIFQQYASTIEAFRPIQSVQTHYNEHDLFDEDEDDDEQGGGDDLWVAEEEEGKNIPIPPPHSYIPSHYLDPSAATTASATAIATTTTTESEDEQDARSKTNSVESTTSSIFSQPNLTISNESFPNNNSSKDKPLPVLIKEPTSPVNKRKSSLTVPQTTQQQQQQQQQQKKLNRLSWTSDTGITSSVVSQNLANEIMSLFDMDFAIDIKVDTAPKLPELPFSKKTSSSSSSSSSSSFSVSTSATTTHNNKRRSQHRLSQDMLSTLIPAFERIALENSIERFECKKPIMNINTNTSNTLVLNSNSNSSRMIKSVPTRSSSLRHRQELLSPVSPSSPSSPSLSPSSQQQEKMLPKKKSILHLASALISPKQQQQKDHSRGTETTTKHTPRKKSTSTVDSAVSTSSSTSSSWSFISDSDQQQQQRAAIKVLSSSTVPNKPLPEPPVAAAEGSKIPRRTLSKGSNNNKKKRRSVVSKRKSGFLLQQKQQQQQEAIPIIATTVEEAVAAAALVKPGLSRSKSAFIKIGSGLKTKKQLKQIRRTSSAKNFLESDYLTEEANVYPQQQQGEEMMASITVSANSFVKRMTSFNWRIKSKGGGPAVVV